MEKQSNQEFIYAEAANGLTVRIPADRFEAWQKAQDELRAGRGKQPSLRMVEQLLSRMVKK